MRANFEQWALTNFPDSSFERYESGFHAGNYKSVATQCRWEGYQSQQAASEYGCKCQGCGIRYIGDLLVPDDVWERIKPEGKAEGAGMLCPTCILHRVVKARIWSAASAKDIADAQQERGTKLYTTPQPAKAVPEGLSELVELVCAEMTHRAWRTADNRDRVLRLMGDMRAMLSTQEPKE